MALVHQGVALQHLSGLLPRLSALHNLSEEIYQSGWVQGKQTVVVIGFFLSHSPPRTRKNNVWSKCYKILMAYNQPNPSQALGKSRFMVSSAMQDSMDGLQGLGEPPGDRCLV